MKSIPCVRRASPRTFLICTVIAPMAIFVGCGRTGPLSERPPDSSQAAAFDTTPSTLGALAMIPIAEIKALVNAKVPPSYSASGDGEEACTRSWVRKRASERGIASMPDELARSASRQPVHRPCA